jgi:hypothetical protein
MEYIGGLDIESLERYRRIFFYQLGIKSLLTLIGQKCH